MTPTDRRDALLRWLKGQPVRVRRIAAAAYHACERADRLNGTEDVPGLLTCPAERAEIRQLFRRLDGRLVSVDPRDIVRAVEGMR